MSLRAEVGSFGFLRQSAGETSTRGQIKGVNGHARASNSSGGLTAHRTATPAEAPSFAYARQPANASSARSAPAMASPALEAPSAPKAALKAAALARGFPPSHGSPAPWETSASVAPKASEASVPTPAASAEAAAALQAALEQWSSTRAQVEDLLGLKDRMDGLFLRVTNQDTALKALERSVAALRQDFSSMSQATGAQSGPRVDALERSLGRLEAGFQDFSSRFERRVDQVEASGATAAASEAAASLPYDATALVALAPDLPPLSRVLLYHPMSREEDGSVTMLRRTLDAQGRPTASTIVVQDATGQPQVVFS